MRSVSILSAAALMALLSACAGNSAMTDPQTIVNANQAAVQATGAVISQGAADACLVRSLANLGQKLSGGGQAAQLSKASAAAGQVCVYQNPVAP